MLTCLEALPANPQDWAAHLLALRQDAAAELGADIAKAWCRGELEGHLVGTTDATSLRPLRRLLASLFTALAEQDIDVEFEWWPRRFNDATARRWCWIEPWLLLSQDEDLLLMERELVAPLLEEAQAGCPKRRYAIGIVMHGIRDNAHQLATANPDNLRAHLQQLDRLRTVAQACHVDEVSSYCDRLASYAGHDEVDRAGALARAADLRKCSAGELDKLAVSDGKSWRVDISQVHGAAEWLVVDIATGAMRIERD